MKLAFTILFCVIAFIPSLSIAQTTTCPLITSYLTIGSRSSQVIALKKYLVSEKILSAGLSTNYFGPSTAAALKKWQKKKGIEPTGATGPKTRAALKNCKGTVTVTPQPNPVQPALIKPTPPIKQPPSGGGGGGGSTPSCTPETQTRSTNCPQGQTGTITETRTAQCPDKTWSTWVQSANTCTTPPAGGGPTPEPKSCIFNGKKVAHNASVTAYEKATVPNGQSCGSENRKCTDGVLSGTYTVYACVVALPEHEILLVTPSGSPHTLTSALEYVQKNETKVNRFTIQLADGTYDMRQHSNSMCGHVPCITFVGIQNPEKVAIIGNKEQPERVVLHFKKPTDAAYWMGGFYLYEPKTYGTFDGFTMKGDYSGWTDKQAHSPNAQRFPSPADIRFTTMALWVRNGAKVTFGPHVRIEGFYFGVAAESQGTEVVADGVRVADCGDAGFIVWSGARLMARDTHVAWCAAHGWGLGTGYVAETADPHKIGLYSDADPETDDATIRTYSYDYAKGVRSSVEIPLFAFIQKEIALYKGRSKLIADGAVAHDNLMAGFLANVGGEVIAPRAHAYRNGISSIANPGPIQKGGFVAQIQSLLSAEDSVSYHNANTGYVSLLQSTLSVARARAFGNIYHGFYSLEAQSVIHAPAARSFSFGAPQQFGFGAERNANIYIDQLTRSGDETTSETFFNDMTQSQVTIVPEKNVQWEYSPVIGVVGNGNAQIIKQ
ncbi:MAG: peptidoglycan-binding domain-containing protein [Minisyncoccia bacterium]